MNDSELIEKGQAHIAEVSELIEILDSQPAMVRNSAAVTRARTAALGSLELISELVGRLATQGGVTDE